MVRHAPTPQPAAGATERALRFRWGLLKQTGDPTVNLADS